MSASYNLEDLVQRAVGQLDKAYCVYSNYKVGCTIVADDGTIYSASNVENASYPLTICAERSAMTYAVSQGHRAFKCIVVATKDGGSCCGACRQFIREFVHPKDDCPIYFCKGDATITQKTTIEELLPFSFGPENLDKQTGM